MNAELITIGDEILIGQVINTNAAYIGEHLLSIGMRLDRITTVGDNEEKILSAFKRAFDDYDLIFVTGGLGPTHDDITKKVLSKYFNSKLVMNQEVLDHVKNFFIKRKIEMMPINEEQALVPECCKILFNNVGTAPGMLFETNNKEMFVMPGVPHEMKFLIDNHILPYLASKVKGFIRTKTLLTTSIGESTLFTLLGDINELTQKSEIAFLPSPRGTRIRIIVKGENEEQVIKDLEEIENKIRDKASDFIFGEGNIDLEEKVGELLRIKNLKISVAESCTGGMISSRITNVSGSSIYFDRGFVTYSNDSKVQTLDIPASLIIDHGAVSEEIAIHMAKSVRMKSKTDIGISTTGIAGPTGGTPSKPVGMVWIGYSDRFETFAKNFYFGNGRMLFKERASQTALDILRKQILKNF